MAAPWKRRSRRSARRGLEADRSADRPEGVTVESPPAMRRGGSRSRTPSELQREVDQPFLVPVHLAQVQAWADLANLVANPMRDERGLRVVENDALLAVQPARPHVHLGDDGVEPEREDPVPEHALLGVEDLALPGEMVDERRNVQGVRCAGSDDRGAIGLTIGDLTGLALRE